MPAERKRAEGSGSQEATEEEQRQLFVRSVVFGTLVVVLGAVAFYLVLTTLRQEPGPDRPIMTAAVTYTVKLLAASPDQRETARAMLGEPALLALAGDSELFLRDLPDGSVALCAGKFPSSDSPDARALLARFKSYTLQGKRCFAEAEIWGYKPPASE